MQDGGQTVNASRPLKFFIAVASVTLLFLPFAAVVVGERGKPLENRAPIAFDGLDKGWGSFGQLGHFLNDRLPLREEAINADAWVDEEVFSEDPAFGGGSSPRVIRGADGFLFLADAIDNACSPHAPPDETAANLARLATIIETSGRGVVTMVAPDKSTVHRKLLPADMDRLDCFDHYTDSLWTELARADIPGFVDLRSTLTDQSVASREPLYLRKDSHWDSAGSAVAVAAAVEVLVPGLWDDDEVVFEGLVDYTGDLTGLQGRPELDQAPHYSVIRPDVRLSSAEVIDDVEGGFNKRYINDAPNGRVIPGRTLMFLDSFGLVSLPQLVPYFEDLTVMRLIDFDADRFSELIESADQVWIMSVERSLGYRLGFEVGSPQFLDQLDAALGP